MGRDTWALLRGNRIFRVFWSARALSLLGDWFNTVAVMTLLARLEHASASSMALIIILKSLPSLLLGPAAGVVADRIPRKLVMVLTDLLRCLVVLGFLVLTWWPNLGLLYGLTVLQMAVGAFYEPARSAVLPSLVTEDDLATAGALEAFTWSFMFASGSALGGLVTHLVGWQVSIVLDALTYLLSALLVLPLAIPGPQGLPGIGPEPPGRSGASGLRELLGWNDLAAGMRYIARSPQVQALLSVKCGWGLASAATLLLTVYGERVYPVGGSAALGIALLYTARGLGTGLGPMVARAMTGGQVPRMRQAIGVGFSVSALAYGLFSMAGSAPAAAICVMLAHLASSTAWVFSTVLLQREVPDALRGRVFATELALFTGTLCLSTWIYGHAIDAGLDLRTAVRVMACAMLLPLMVWTLLSRRAARLAPAASPVARS